MQKISEELARIAALFEVQYIRAASISDSNMLTHYEAITGGVIIYTGFGNLGYTFEGAAPVNTTEVECFCLFKNQTKDNTAEQTDELLAQAERLAADVIYNFTTPYNDITEFTLEYVTINDSLLTGYRLVFEADLAGLACSPAGRIEGTFTSVAERAASEIWLINPTNKEAFEVGDTILVKTNDGIYNVEGLVSVIATDLAVTIDFIGVAGAGKYSKEIEATIQPFN